MPVALLPLLWSVLHVSKLVSSYAGGGLSDCVARTKVILAGWTVYALTYLLMGLATEAWQAWALFVVYGTYHGLTEPAEKALVKDIAPSDARGRAYGYYNFVVGAAAVPAGALTGWLWQTWSPLAALGAGAALAELAVALVVSRARRAPPSSPPPPPAPNPKLIPCRARSPRNPPVALAQERDGVREAEPRPLARAFVVKNGSKMRWLV